MKTLKTVFAATAILAAFVVATEAHASHPQGRVIVGPVTFSAPAAHHATGYTCRHNAYRSVACAPVSR